MAEADGGEDEWGKADGRGGGADKGLVEGRGEGRGKPKGRPSRRIKRPRVLLVCPTTVMSRPFELTGAVLMRTTINGGPAPVNGATGKPAPPRCAAAPGPERFCENRPAAFLPL